MSLLRHLQATFHCLDVDVRLGSVRLDVEDDTDNLVMVRQIFADISWKTRLDSKKLSSGVRFPLNGTNINRSYSTNNYNKMYHRNWANAVWRYKRPHPTTPTIDVSVVCPCSYLRWSRDWAAAARISSLSALQRQSWPGRMNYDAPGLWNIWGYFISGWLVAKEILCVNISTSLIFIKLHRLLPFLVRLYHRLLLTVRIMMDLATAVSGDTNWII